MKTENYYKGVTHVVSLSTDEGKKCEYCSFYCDGPSNFAEAINHYVEKHEYKLLHIGTDTTHGNDGSPWHNTLAVLGK